MADRLSMLTSRYAADEVSFRKGLQAPLLLWEDAPPPEHKIEEFWDTQGKIQLNPGNDPLVFTMAKLHRKSNAFGIGVTLGRTSNNDIVVVEPSVSRFHAFFQYNENTQLWYVVDAESHNGTFLNEERLVAGRPGPLKERANLRFGGARMRFLSPRAFEAFLMERSTR